MISDILSLTELISKIFDYKYWMMKIKSLLKLVLKNLMSLI